MSSWWIVPTLLAPWRTEAERSLPQKARLLAGLFVFWGQGFRYNQPLATDEMISVRQWMIVLAAFVIMAVGFLASLRMFADESRLKQLLSEHVEVQTGRRLNIDGSVSVRFFPRFRIDAESVSLSGPAEFAGPDLLRSDRMSVEVRLLPLILGQVETREVILEGTQLQLVMDESGHHSLAGLMRRPGRAGAPGIAASGPLRLEDMVLDLSGLKLGTVRQIQVDRIELDGLSFDRALDFRFSGAIGSPPLLSDVSVNGILFVPAETGHFRLADMRLSARLTSAGVPFDLFGSVSFSALPPLSIRLDESRLKFHGQELMVEASYEELLRPRFSFSATASELDPAALPAVFGHELTSQWGPWLAGAVAEHDFAAELSVERLLLGRYEIPDFRVTVSAEDGTAQLAFAETTLPGALVRGAGEVHGETNGQSRIEMLVSLEVDDLGRFLDAGGFGGAADGVGQVRLVPGSATDNNALAEAQVELFAGRMAGLNDLREAAGVAGADRFQTLTGSLLFYPDVVVLRSLLIRDEVSEIRLQALMLRGSGRLSGTAVVEFGEETQRFELGGSRARPQFRPMDPSSLRQ